MRSLRLLSCFLLLTACGFATGLAELSQQIRDSALDTEKCFEIREVSLFKQDLRIYLTDGHLIFTKPVAGARLGAIFMADTDIGDAELLMFPPRRSERMSLAAATGSPNLNEHFNSALFVFSDGTAEKLLADIEGRATVRHRPEKGAALAVRWNSSVQTMLLSFQIRLMHDLLSGNPQQEGFFYASVVGNRLGAIDIVYDPRDEERLNIGRVTMRDNAQYFDTWTSFEGRDFREGKRHATPEAGLRDYRIDATLQPDLLLQVVTRATLPARRTGERAMALDISQQMRVKEARVNGEAVEWFQRESSRTSLFRGSGNDSFLIALPPGLGAEERAEIAISHEGMVVADAGNEVFFVGARGTWYPNRAPDYTHYELTFTRPRALDLVASGELVQERTEGDLRISHYKTTSPIRLFGFNLGNFQRTRITRGAVTVEVCANRGLERPLQPRFGSSIILLPSPDPWRRRRGEMVRIIEPMPNVPAVRSRALAEKVADAFEFMTQHFGAPPWRHLTFSPIPGAFGQGFPGLVYLSTLAYFDANEAPLAQRPEFEKVFFTDLLHAHETAHQWWGNTVYSRSHEDEWLTEALADYSSMLFLEKQRGRDTLQFVLNAYRDHLLEKDDSGKTVESTGPIVWGNRLRTSLEPRAWRLITYEKGSWIMHMLRRRMGDAQFLKMLGELRRRFEFKALTTEDFRAIAAEFLPRGHPDPKLEGFFEQFVYGTGIPELTMKYTISGSAPKVRVKGTVVQTGVADEFSITVPVEIQIARGKSITHWVRTENEPVEFEVVVPQRPSRVLLDPNDTVLAVKPTR
jgi:hypothetical protein